MIRTVWIVAALALMPRASAHAQSTDPDPSLLHLESGETVIVTRLSSNEPLRGRVVRVANDGLELSNRRARQIVPLADLDRIERPKDRVWDGALIGYAVGLGAGAAVVLLDPCDPPSGSFSLCVDGPGMAFAFGALIAGPIGAAVGYIADAMWKKPRLVFVRGYRAGVAIAPTLSYQGAGVRVALQF